jgi:hypothetical protein
VFRVDGKKGAVSEEPPTPIFRVECRMVETDKNRLPPTAVKSVADASVLVFEECMSVPSYRRNLLLYRYSSGYTFPLNHAVTFRGYHVFQDTVVLSLLLS